MKSHANMCISSLKHAQEILIIDISTGNMSFIQHLTVKQPYPAKVISQMIYSHFYVY